MKFDYTVHCDIPTGENDRFWAAAGSDSLYAQIFTESGEALLSRCREHGTLRWMRNHFTLSSLDYDGFSGAGGDVYTEDAQGNPVYHFEKINAVFARYLEYGIRPVVEMDFMPDALARTADAGLKGDIADHEGADTEKRLLVRSWPKDWDKWAALLRAFTENLRDTFGTEEIRLWYFEFWNEPDNIPPAEWPQFFRMYDIFADAVTGVDPLLRVGGPATFRYPFFKAFLEHAVRGTNYVTGRTGSRLDFISHHIYGMSGGWLDAWPLVQPTVQRFVQEILWLQRTIDVYPELRGKPILLDEWGVCSNYEKTADRYPPLEMRNTEFSALFFVKLADCIRELRSRFGVNIRMLLYWGFCLEDIRKTPFAGHRDLMTYPSLPKPVLTAMELSARLGGTLLQKDGAAAGGTLGLTAAADPNRVTLLLYSFNELDSAAEGPAANGTVTLHGLPDGNYRLTETLLDRNRHNTCRLYRSGAPDEAQAEASRCLPDSVRTLSVHGEVLLPLTLPAHSLCLLELDRIV